MITLQHVFDESAKNNRVCPQPRKWNELYEILADKRRKGIGWEPALPLILAAWWDTPAISKIRRLQEHIQWAADHDCLTEVYDFLHALSDDDWHHVGD
jgi:hypothetical protein